MERQFLYEAESGSTSLDLLKYKYPQSVIAHRVLETLYQEDPSPDKSMFDWMVQQNIATAHHEDVNNVMVGLVKQFFIFQDKMKIKDIHFFHDLDTLHHELSHVRAHLSTAEQKKFKVQEGRVMYEDTHYRVLKPKDMNEVCNSGHDTPWCSAKNLLPKELNDYVVYVVVHKQLKAPEAHLEDYEAFHRQQQRYWTLRKLLVFISKHFKGTAAEADLDDYLLIDASGNERDESISELSTPHIEKVVFDDFESSDNKDKLKRELELPDLEVIEEWCVMTEATPQQRKVLTERYQMLSEQYQNPELTEGDRVELIYMKDGTTRRPAKGERGEVVAVEQTPHGVQYLMKWEKGSTMALLPDTDVYRKLDNLNEADGDRILRFLKKEYENKIVYLLKGVLGMTDTFPQKKGIPGKRFKYFKIREIFKVPINKEGYDSVMGFVIDPHNMDRLEIRNLFGMISRDLKDYYNVLALIYTLDDQGMRRASTIPSQV